jgi:hypothetical protein
MWVILSQIIMLSLFLRRSAAFRIVNSNVLKCYVIFFCALFYILFFFLCGLMVPFLAHIFKFNHLEFKFNTVLFVLHLSFYYCVDFKIIDRYHYVVKISSSIFKSHWCWYPLFRYFLYLLFLGVLIYKF